MIDKSGRWWKGTTVNDLEEYLKAFSADSYPISEFRLSQCSCGGVRFFLRVEQDEGIAKRVCENCTAEHFICDSAEHREPGQRLKAFKCITCKAKVANVGVGFSLYENKSAVRWLFVGNRCAECGVLGSMVDWKVGYEPSLHLLGLA
jgi:hypothetical protein